MDATTRHPSDSYEATRAEAQREANETGADYALEGPHALSPRWTRRRLPLPANRYGVDLQCEVVRPEVPVAPDLQRAADALAGFPPSAATVRLEGLETRLLVATSPAALEAARAWGSDEGKVVLSLRELLALAEGVADAPTPAEREVRRAEGLEHFARRSGVELRWVR